MARLPKNFFDNDPDINPEPVKVPKGWTAIEDDIPEEDTENHKGYTPKEFAQLEEEIAEIEDDNLDEAPSIVVPKALPKKRRHAFIEDFDDEEEAPKVDTTARKGRSTRSFVEDWGVDDDAPPVVAKSNQRFGRGAAAAVVEDDEEEPENAVPAVAEEEEDTTPAPLPQREVIVPVKRLSEKALLVSLNISQWSGRRFDRDVSNEVNAQKAATANAGRFNKMLLPDCAELAEVHRQTSSLRNWFVEKTMPWMNDGARITPSSTYLDFTSEFRRREAEWEKAVDALDAAYPALKAKAPQQLQSMYNPDDYPTRYELRSKFSMAIRAFPLPDKEDFRVELDPATMAALKDSMADVEGDLARSVVAECYTRLGKAVGAMADRLGDPDAVFRNSLTENLAEAVSALRDLNICGDPQLEAMRRRIEKTLTGFTADELRNDMAARKTAAVTAKAAVEDINRRMAGLL